MYDNTREDMMSRKQAIERRSRRRARQRRRKIKILLMSFAAIGVVCAFTVSLMVLWYYAVGEKGEAADVQVARMDIDSESMLHSQQIQNDRVPMIEKKEIRLSRNQIRGILNRLPAVKKAYVEQILDASVENTEAMVHKVVKRANEYPEEVLEMLSKYPETVPYAADYLDKVGEVSENPVIDLTEEVNERKIPLLIQWDERWGYYDYGSSKIGISGCGATALSMVVVGLTGDRTANPKAVADFSVANGYITANASTQWTLFTIGSAQYGLHCLHMPMSRQNVVDSLRAGRPIIASMKPGDFTKGGHFIVLTGLTGNGRVMVNDPNSYVNSERTWSVDDILNQAKSMWSFSTDPI